MANPIRPNVANMTQGQGHGGGGDGHGNGRRSKSRKKKGPVIFCRPGVDQLPKSDLIQELELSIKFAALNLDRNVCESFEDMNLHPQIMAGISAYGLERPAYIQQRAIVPCIEGRDAIVQAQSGMGKTAALVIAVLQRLDRNDPKCQALILAPTRELAEQIQKVFMELSKFMVQPKVTSYACIGGRGDTRQCKGTCLTGRQVIIGTLGRTAHMLVGDGNGPFLNTGSVKVLALDEADQMLDGSYGRDLTTVLERIPPPGDCQVIMMSATMPGNILKLAYRFMVKPATFLVRNFQLTLDGIQQYFVNVMDEADKLVTFADLFPLLLNDEKSRGMVFCNTRFKAEAIVKRMTDAGHDVTAITGNMSQRKRDQIMKKFRRGESGYRVLITSDLLGRGIDIKQINLVVNYDLPKLKESYIHRVGRAGRYGRKGIALSFVETKQQKEFEGLKEFYATQIFPMPAEQEFRNLLTASQAEN